ncbi:cytochrome b5 heme-binding domain-containing protein [Pseudoscourfieldia marina]
MSPPCLHNNVRGVGGGVPGLGLASRLSRSGVRACRGVRARAASLASPPVTTTSPSSPTNKDAGKVHLKIDGTWYDCTGWAKAHPGGRAFVELLDGRDASGVFWALHGGRDVNGEAAERLAKLPKLEMPPSAAQGSQSFQPSGESAELSSAFQELRSYFETNGFFERNPWQEAMSFATTLGLYVVGSYMAYNPATFAPPLAAVVLGVAQQQGGWLGHDMIHGKGWWCRLNRRIPALLNAFDSEWWATKHSMHHSFTNTEGRDGDIKLEPLYYLRPPSESGRSDVTGLRRWQHLTGYPFYAFTYFLWRYRSIDCAVRRRDWGMLAMFAVNAAWLHTLGAPVALSSIAVAGFLCGAIVTATHQVEHMMSAEERAAIEAADGGADDFVAVQFATTHDADCGSAAERWLWGGMDVQLVHHLFPTMPRYRLHEARDITREWSAGQKMPTHLPNGGGPLTYKASPPLDLIRLNYDVLEKNARA